MRSTRDADVAPELLQVLPAVPASLRHSRAGLAAWLAGLGWPADPADDLILAVNEAVANVIDHAYPAADPGPVGLHARCGSGSTPATRRVTITVTDHGDWDPEHRTIDRAGSRGQGLCLDTRLHRRDADPTQRPRHRRHPRQPRRPGDRAVASSA